MLVILLFSSALCTDIAREPWSQSWHYKSFQFVFVYAYLPSTAYICIVSVQPLLLMPASKLKSKLKSNFKVNCMHCIIFVIKFVYGVTCETYCKIRGHGYTLKKIVLKWDLCQHLFTERIISIWNNLEEQTVASSFNRFERNSWFVSDIQEIFQNPIGPNLVSSGEAAIGELHPVTDF